MYSAIKENKRNTVLIIGLFLLIFAAIGFLVGWLSDSYDMGIIVTLIGVIYAFVEYFAASRQAMTMAGGQEIQKSDSPMLWNVVENLAISQGLPMPRVFIINDPSPNAFATGRDPQHASVAATTGLLDMLDKRELTGVMAHEMSHVKNYDIRLNTIVFGLCAAVGFLSDLMLRMVFSGSYDDDDNHVNPLALLLIVVMIVFIPIAAMLIRLGISRQREYLADSTGALMTRDPEGLASALAKLGGCDIKMKHASSTMAHMYINDPSKPGFMTNLFSTHPPIEDRIKRLEASGAKM